MRSVISIFERINYFPFALRGAPLIGENTSKVDVKFNFFEHAPNSSYFILASYLDLSKQQRAINYLGLCFYGRLLQSS